MGDRATRKESERQDAERDARGLLRDGGGVLLCAGAGTARIMYSARPAARIALGQSAPTGSSCKEVLMRASLSMCTGPFYKTCAFTRQALPMTARTNRDSPWTLRLLPKECIRNSG